MALTEQDKADASGVYEPPGDPVVEQLAFSPAGDVMATVDSYPSTGAHNNRICDATSSYYDSITRTVSAQPRLFAARKVLYICGIFHEVSLKALPVLALAHTLPTVPLFRARRGRRCRRIVAEVLAPQ